MPNGLVHAHGREVPARQLRALPRSGNRPRARAATATSSCATCATACKELTTRGYLDAADETVDCLLLFIPNEQVYAFVQEHDRAILDDALRNKIVVCSPLTLYAVLAVVRQAVDNFRLERTSNEILGLLGEFSLQWEKYVAQLDKVQQRFDAVAQGVRRAHDDPAPRPATPARQDRVAAPRGARARRCRHPAVRHSKADARPRGSRSVPRA